MNEHRGEKPPPSHPDLALDDDEKARLKAWIDSGQPLSPQWRARLLGTSGGPELLWPGKSEPSEPPLVPLRLRERHDHRAVSSARDADDEALGGNPHPWRNRLIQGDNWLALAALRAASVRDEIERAGGLKLIYIDPPFATGNDYPVTVAVGERSSGRENALVRNLAYRDSWAAGKAEYLSMMYARLWQMRDLLADDGAIILHCDWRISAQLRLVMDEIFGEAQFVNEIVWFYYNKFSAARHCLPRSHDTLLYYSKTGRHRLSQLRLPRKNPVRQLVRENVDGVLKNARDAAGRIRYRISRERRLLDVWEMPQMQPASSHWTGYGTQKHHDLVARILELGSRPGDLVADFFCGSGTLPAVADRLGRKWIAVDSGTMAIHITRKRLLDGSALRGACKGENRANPPSFDIWHMEDGARIKTRRPADSPAARLTGLAAETDTEGDSVRVRLTDFVPRPISEQLDGETDNRSGDTNSRERLLVENGRLIRERRGRGGRVDREELTRRWSDWIDYWAVDFGTLPQIPPAPEGRSTQEAAAPDGGTAVFHADWCAFRTRKRRGLPLESAWHAYSAPGEYRVSVMAVDIFGRESRGVFSVAVAPAGFAHLAAGET